MSISPTLRGEGAVPAVERRSSPRRSVMDRRLVTVNLDNKDAGLMVDLSETGMAVQALARIKPGGTTLLQFELPDTAARIETSGSVAWVDPVSGRAGIRFQNLPETSLASLKEWLCLKASEDRPATSAIAVAPAPAMLGPESKVAEIAALQREITSQGLDREAALALIVQRTRSLTHADGAAIVLGNSKWMSCCASSGAAPPVGADLQPDAGLSGECVRTGVTVRCEDTELDPRVDREACRSINLRSAVIVPLFARGNINGLVEVFYASARAFDGRDVLTLRRMADLISATLSSPVSREPKPPATVANAAVPEAQPNPAPVRDAPAAPMIPPMPRIASPPAQVVCDVCGHENAPSSSDCEKCEVPLPGVGPRESAGHSASLETGTEQSKPWMTVRLNASPRLLILIALLVLLASIWGWQQYKSRRASAAPPVTTSSALELPTVDSTAVPVSASEGFFTPANFPSSSVPAGLKIGTVSGAKSRPPSVLPEDVTTTVPARSAVKPSPTSPAVPSPRPAEMQGVLAPPVGETTPIPILATTVFLPPPVPPNVTGPATAALSSARLIHRVEPVYPKLALSSRVQGPVVLKATILRSGRLSKIQVVSGNALLVGAAVNAVQQWRYKPVELDGKPVDTETTVTVNFSLGAR